MSRDEWKEGEDVQEGKHRVCDFRRRKEAEKQEEEKRERRRRREKRYYETLPYNDEVP